MIHDTDLSRPRKLIRSLLGRKDDDSPREWGRRSEREQVLNDIASFILDHGLELSAANLETALRLATGGNPRLRRRVDERAAQGQPITQGWLDEQRRDGDAGEELTKVAARLEQSLANFRTVTTSARDAVSHFGNEMAGHARRLDDPAADGEEALRRVREATRAVIATTGSYRDRLASAEQEAHALRAELDKARQEGMMDPLTGLPNRRGFDVAYEREFRLAEANLEPMCVAFCDIDRFKAVNDRFGHDTGDRVIAAIAQALKAISSDSCHAARYGGEEFVMVFRGLTISQAYERLDGARARLAGRRFVHEATGEVIGSVTLSGGLADVFAFGDRTQVLRAADEALYRAKNEGRNQIRIAAA